ncbi:hypothetical protein SLS58_002958 [Diplodia intermedia]|uniref:Glycosyltransferase family 25 protein n=1 Tax=Diplodia intermedia TaxID=856260 RepID=A0ABR3TXB3_9PEZI
MLLPNSRSPIRPGYSRTVFVFAGITALFLWQFYILDTAQPVQLAKTLFGGQESVEFQTIIAISSEDSSKPGAWRQHGLLAAANRTGLEVNVHQSRHVPDDELHAFMQHTSKSGESPRIGSARAWLAHLDALKYVLAHDINTALILEDDADWDVRIRQILAPDAAVPSLVREILDDSENNDADADADAAGLMPSFSSNATLSNNSTIPYTLGYDILWLGHCASGKTPRSRQLDTLADAATVPPANRLRAFADRYAYTPLPDGTRSIMRSPGPTCTFAYARFITFNIMYSARCNAEKGDGELVECMPTDEELDWYTT